MIDRQSLPHELRAAPGTVPSASVAEVAAEIGCPRDAVAIDAAIGVVYARWPELPWSMLLEGLRIARNCTAAETRGGGL